jgi:hypothetical protein
MTGNYQFDKPEQQAKSATPKGKIFNTLVDNLTNATNELS